MFKNNFIQKHIFDKLFVKKVFRRIVRKASGLEMEEWQVESPLFVQLDSWEIFGWWPSSYQNGKERKLISSQRKFSFEQDGQIHIDSEFIHPMEYKAVFS